MQWRSVPRAEPQNCNQKHLHDANKCAHQGMGHDRGGQDPTTLSHVRVDGAHSHSCVDTAIAQGRVLLPLLFNLLQLSCGHPSLLSKRPLTSLVKCKMQMTWSFLRTRRRICSLGLTRLPFGDVSGDSLLASALVSPQFFFSRSRWTASISQWCAFASANSVTTLVRPRQPSHRSQLWAACTKHNLVAQRRPSLFRSSLVVHLRAPEHNVCVGVCKRESFNTVCLRQITPQVVSSFVAVASGHS